MRKADAQRPYTDIPREERQRLRKEAFDAYLRSLPTPPCNRCGKDTLIRQTDTTCDWCLYT